MAFTDHKISAFAHTISELADQPNLPPDELKARFDACPEELRVAHNALCDEAARLDERVGGIVDQTFADTITKAMLSSELRSELDAKATQSALSSEVSARKSETTARQSADTALSNRISAVESKIPTCLRVISGSYTGNGTENRTISLGFRPYFVIVFASFMVEWELPDRSLWFGQKSVSLSDSHLTDSGFVVSTENYVWSLPGANSNEEKVSYTYLALGL